MGLGWVMVVVDRQYGITVITGFFCLDDLGRIFKKDMFLMES
jgi:hypothetical protein